MGKGGGGRLVVVRGVVFIHLLSVDCWSFPSLS